uniref:Acyltransferase n=1 Tax=Globisporangium ultimum (strain ATCC 200006 / CBS 805.95 / DAOM BR144) TaxID=431595 RepID=K3WLX5_GLOUD
MVLVQRGHHSSTASDSAAATAHTSTASPASADAAPTDGIGKVRFGVYYLAIFIALAVSLNCVLLWLVPYGWALELAEASCDASKRYLFVIHPHGIVGFSAWLAFGADCVGFSLKNQNIDIALATINVNFYMPFWRDLLLALGFVDASFKSLSSVLQRKRSVAIVLGGAAEALDSHPNTNNIILNKRKGIIRLALSTGTPLVPVFIFGETDLFYQVPNPKGSLLRKVQESFLSIFKFSPPLIVGAGSFGCPVGLFPYARPLHVVTGKPIEAPHIASPTNEDVVKYQAVYRKALEKLYADHEKHYYEVILPEALRPAKRPELRIVA